MIDLAIGPHPSLLFSADRTDMKWSTRKKKTDEGEGGETRHPIHVL
jgi:hypothetical protein